MEALITHHLHRKTNSYAQLRSVIGHRPYITIAINAGKIIQEIEISFLKMIFVNCLIWEVP